MTFTDDDFQRHRNRIKENLNADIVDSLLGGATADRRPVKEGDKDVFPVPPELTLAMPYTSGLDGTVIQLTDLFDGSTVNNSKVKLLLHLLMLDGKIYRCKETCPPLSCYIPNLILVHTLSVP